VEIEGSKHRPPGAHLVPELVEDLCDYVNEHWDTATSNHVAMIQAAMSRSLLYASHSKTSASCPSPYRGRGSVDGRGSCGSGRVRASRPTSVEVIAVGSTESWP
jgi:hypothetical protein